MFLKLLKRAKPGTVDPFMKDWPTALRMSAAAAELAKDIYRRAGEIRNIEMSEQTAAEDFARLPVRIRQQYNAIAATALRQLQQVKAEPDYDEAS